eukprot:TRINITY_DN5059_c0_g1_i1.p1 TRINITY_DN5059_c0_g1~~TRINITY_DN5059_c0_g1_i1.p1  ORF type:complete len:1085 (+),score=167.54 TRINITY_DN5059_c0_g1_i1:1259-4513(+)
MFSSAIGGAYAASPFAGRKDSTGGGNNDEDESNLLAPDNSAIGRGMNRSPSPGEQTATWRTNTPPPSDVAGSDDAGKGVVQTQGADDDDEAWTLLSDSSRMSRSGRTRETRYVTPPGGFASDDTSSQAGGGQRSLADIIVGSSPVLKHKLVAEGTVGSEGKGTFRRHCPKVGCWRNTVFVVSEGGRVAVWRIPQAELAAPELSLSSLIKTDYEGSGPEKRGLGQQNKKQDNEEEEEDESDTNTMSKLMLKEWAAADIKDGWRITEEGGTDIAVSSMLFIEEDFILARGYQNGDLELAQLPWGDAAVDRVLRSAHKGAVLALLAYRNANRKYLISAGADNIIKVWSLKLSKAGMSLVHTFRHHAGPVTHLFRVSTQFSDSRMSSKKPLRGAAGYEGGIFLSISKDKSVGLFSLENMNCMRVFAGHPSQITRVAWRVEQDYLFVTCDDGSLSIWGLNTGILESCVYGQIADDVGTHNTFYPTRNRVTVKTETQTGTLASFTMRLNPKESPLVVIELDVRNIVKELYTQSKAPPTEETPRAKTPTVPHVIPPTTTTSNTSAVAVPRVHSVGLLQGLLSTSAGSGSLLASSSPTASSGVGGEVLRRIQGVLAYHAFTYLLPWGVDPSIDSMAESELSLFRPIPDVTYAVKSGKGMLAALVPAASECGGRWQCSDHLSGVHTLAAITVTKALLHIGNKNASSKLLSFYCGVLPDVVEHYIYPSLPFIAHYYLDMNDDVQHSARSLFSSTINRLSFEQLRIFAQSWAHMLGSAETEAARMNIILVLAILGAESPDCLAPTVSSEVGNMLVHYIKQKDHPLRLAATELLGRGFRTWQPHLKDGKALIRSLFALTLLSSPISLSGTANKSLMLIATIDPRMAIDGLGDLIYRPDMGAKEHADALMLISQLVRKHPVEIFSELPRLVETVVHSLDPNVPQLREGCLKAATTVLHSLVKQYPMVSFHPSQRFAVGTQKGVIIIWDLKTASRLHVLEGHKGPVSAVAFNAKGDVLCSYSVGDARVLLWGARSTLSLISNLFASAPSILHSHEVSRVSSLPPLSQMLETVRLQWVSERTLELVRGWEGSTTLSFKH